MDNDAGSVDEDNGAETDFVTEEDFEQDVENFNPMDQVSSLPHVP